jgi:hypothetical protein
VVFAVFHHGAVHVKDDCEVRHDFPPV